MTDQLLDLAAKARVVARAAVTYLVVAVAILTFAIDELAPLAPGSPIVEEIVRVLGIAVSVIAGAVSIIRRVTPVAAPDRGVLPPPTGDPIPPTT